MLCQFTVKNFKSIRDEMTFDMQAASISEHADSVIIGQDGQRFLPVSVLYGPNGGGKSNVLEALNTLYSVVLRPVYATIDQEKWDASLNNVPVKPFAFSPETRKEPTELEIFFRTKQAEYQYEIHLKDGTICYENMERMKLDTRRISPLFSRDESNIKLSGALSRLKISEEMSPSLPVLSYLGITYAKNAVIQDAMDWFKRKIAILNYGNPLREMRTAISKSQKIKELMLLMMREMDLGVEDFRVEEDKDGQIEVYTKHTVNGYTAELQLEEESSGTLKLFGMMTILVRCLLDGATLVVDELDAKIHPLLLRHIIMHFTDPELNRKGAQLIFTSHDLTTMNSEVFRRDEIWFVAKGNAQNSKLYSLVEFKTSGGTSVRKDAKYDKQYLEGKYGADPYLRRIINWGEEDA